MRQSRLKKYKKKSFMFLMTVQLIAIYFVTVIWLLKFHSLTNAAFNDIERLYFTLQTEWQDEKPPDDKEPPDDEEPPDDKEPPDDDGTWDKSSLSFITQSVHCEDGLISAVIRNGADSRNMKGPVTYEVYWTEKGNPKPEHGGHKLDSGIVPALKAGETFEIFYAPTRTGNYMFKAYQRPGHPGKGELWSESLRVDQKCLEKGSLASENDLLIQNVVYEKQEINSKTQSSEQNETARAGTNSEKTNESLKGDDILNENNGSLD